MSLTKREQPVSHFRSHPGSDYRRFSVAFLILIPAVLALCTYDDNLDCYFTGTDSFSLIETSRIESFEDIKRILTRPLMDGTDFVSVAKFYRPLANLSYGLDYLVWNLDPFGFHLTNLIFHILNTILVALLMRSLAGGDLTIGLLAAIIFTTHPILVESVPSIDRRHDLIASLFLMLSLTLFVQASRVKERRAALSVLSVLSYVASLGGKEIAVILPGIIFVYSLIFGPEPGIAGRFSRSVKAIAPYFVATLAYVAWRWHVLDGLGGYVENGGDQALGEYLLQIISSYGIDLLYPIDFFKLSESFTALSFLLAQVLIFVAYSLLYFRCSRGTSGDSRRLLYGRLFLFFSLWIILPLALFCATHTFAHRSMYMVVVPFAGILAVSMVHCFRLLRSRSRDASQSVVSSGTPQFLRWGQIAIVASSLVAWASLALYSPVFRTYAGWNESARVSRYLLEELGQVVQHLPARCTLHLYNLPEGISSLQSNIPRAREVTYMRDYSVKSWMNLVFPHNAMRVVVHSRSWLTRVGSPLGISSYRASANNLVIKVVTDAAFTGHSPNQLIASPIRSPLFGQVPRPRKSR
ncbi:MAG: hypothetical protein AB1473_16680 [Thermodesulfobacteriota bacterium]